MFSVILSSKIAIWKINRRNLENEHNLSNIGEQWTIFLMPFKDFRNIST